MAEIDRKSAKLNQGILSTASGETSFIQWKKNGVILAIKGANQPKRKPAKYKIGKNGETIKL